MAATKRFRESFFRLSRRPRLDRPMSGPELEGIVDLARFSRESSGQMSPRPPHPQRVRRALRTAMSRCQSAVIRSARMIATAAAATSPRRWGPPLVRALPHPVLTKRRVPGMLRTVLLVVLALSLWFASVLVRTDLFVSQPIHQALNSVGERLGGHFAFDHAGPSGWTGVEVSELTFVSNDGSVQVEIESLRVTPSLAALLSGDRAVTSIEIDEPHVRLGADSWLWFQSRLASGTPAESEGASSESMLERLPEVVRVNGGSVWLESPHDRVADISISLQNLELTRAASELRLVGCIDLDGQAAQIEARIDGTTAGQLTVDFDGGVGLTPNWLGFVRLPSLVSESAALRVGGVELNYGSDVPLSVTLLALQATNLGLRVPGIAAFAERWRVDGLWAERVTWRPTHAGQSVALENGAIELEGLFSTSHIGVQSAELWSDADVEDFGFDVRLGRPRDPGYLLLHASAELEGGNGDLIFSADADDYPLHEWARLLEDELDAEPVDGRISGELTFAIPLVEGSTGPRYDAEVPLLATLDVSLRDGTAYIPLLSNRTLEHIDVAVSGDVHLDLSRRELRWDAGRVVLGGVPLRFDATFSYPDAGPRLSMWAEVREANAERLRQALPSGLAPTLDQVRFDGLFSAYLYLDLDTQAPDDAVVEWRMDVDGLSVREFSDLLPLDQLAGDFRISVATSDGFGRELGPRTARWTAYADAGDYIAGALVAAEDGRFWQHDGFDWRAIEQSVRENLRARSIVRGGSTLSQQLSRSLFLEMDRTLGRKFEEAFITWQLETLLDKERILELYVNTVHWGPGVYGISEAAGTYFNRVPSQLSVVETAFLASILPNPNLFGTQYARGIVPPSRRSKMCNILRNMRRQGDISRRQENAAIDLAEDGRVSVVPPPRSILRYRPSDAIEPRPDPQSETSGRPPTRDEATQALALGAR